MKITNGDAVAMLLRRTQAKEPEAIAKVLAEEFPELARWAAKTFINRRGPKSVAAAVDERQADLPIL